MPCATPLMSAASEEKKDFTAGTGYSVAAMNATMIMKAVEYNGTLLLPLCWPFLAMNSFPHMRQDECIIIVPSAALLAEYCHFDHMQFVSDLFWSLRRKRDVLQILHSALALSLADLDGAHCSAFTCQYCPCFHAALASFHVRISSEPRAAPSLHPSRMLARGR